MDAPIAVITPTWLEYLAAKVALPHLVVRMTGVGAKGWMAGGGRRTLVVVCGLAGALDPDITSGTVIVPESIGDENGTMTNCDPAMVKALTAGAKLAGFRAVGGSMLTASRIVTGDERHEWATRGFSSVDMETALIAGRIPRFAAVRVALDTPAHPISPQWVHPAQALFSQSLRKEMGWLAMNAPRFALRAAVVIRYALDVPSS